MIFPAIDLQDGRSVRLYKGDFAKETIINPNPVDQASQYENAGVGALHLVDLDGAKAGKPVNVDIVKRVRAAFTGVLEIGGGIRDKDAVDGSLMICEMFAYYKTHGQSLLDVLNGLYAKYGYCLNTLHSYEFEGAEGFTKMQNIMEKFRKDCPEGWCGHKILAVSDYMESVTRYTDGKEKYVDLPKSNVLKYQLEGNLSVVVRPSGTEPKLKMYLSVSAGDKGKAQEIENVFVSELEKMME